MKTISSSQIEHLYQFTRQHYVEYYDVQTELVDHLASAIETHWQEKPDQDFEKLLQKEFKKFGVFGFMEVVEKRQRVMQKKYLKLILKEILKYLKLPKIIFFVFTLWIVFTVIIQLKYGTIILFFSFIAAIAFLLTITRLRLFKLKKAVKNGNKKLYLLEETLLNSGQFFGLVFIPVHLFTISGYLNNPENFGNLFHLSFAFIFTIALFVFHIMLNVLPSKKESILKKAYPEMNLENV